MWITFQKFFQFTIGIGICGSILRQVDCSLKNLIIYSCSRMRISQYDNIPFRIYLKRGLRHNRNGSNNHHYQYCYSDTAKHSQLTNKFLHVLKLKIDKILLRSSHFNNNQYQQDINYPSQSFYFQRKIQAEMLFAIKPLHK